MGLGMCVGGEGGGGRGGGRGGGGGGRDKRRPVYGMTWEHGFFGGNYIVRSGNLRTREDLCIAWFGDMML